MSNEDNFITEIKQQLNYNADSFISFPNAEKYLYEDHFRLREKSYYGNLRGFISAPCDFVSVIEVEPNNGELLVFKKHFQLTDEKLNEYKANFKNQAQELLKSEKQREIYWEIDAKNFITNEKNHIKKHQIENGEAILIKQRPYFNLFGLQFCLNRKSIPLHIDCLAHEILFLVSDVKQLNEEKIENRNFYINKLLEQRIEKLYILIDFIWEQNTQNMQCKTMPSSYLSDPSELRRLAMQNTNNNTKAYSLALNAIKCNEITSPEPKEENVDVYTDSFFQWAAKQSFFPEWFFLTDYFKNLNSKGYEKAAMKRRFQSDYIPIEEAAKYFAHLSFDSVDIAQRGVRYYCDYFPLYIFKDGIYIDLITYLENAFEPIYMGGIERFFPNKNTIEFFPLNGYHIDKIESVLIKNLFVSRENIKNMAEISGFSKQLANNKIGQLTPILSSFSLVSEILEKQDYIEAQNKYSENKVNLEIAAALLTVCFFLNDSFKMSVTKAAKHKRNGMEKHKQLLDKLKNDFKTRNAKHEINLVQLLFWITSNCVDFPILEEKIIDGLDKLTIAGVFDNTYLYTSVKNNFIATMLRLIYLTIKAGIKLNRIEQPLIPLGKNYLATESVTDLYINEIKALSQVEFKGLNTLAKEHNLEPKELFSKVVKLNLRWFVYVKNGELDFGCLAGKECGWTILPKIGSEQISKKLQLIPYYKLTKEDSAEILKAHGEIAIIDDDLEFPEELYFLDVHFGYWIKSLKSNYIVTFDDIVIPEYELQKFKKRFPILATANKNEALQKNAVPQLSEETIRNLEVGRSVRTKAKLFGEKSGKERQEEAEKKWETLLEIAYSKAENKPNSYTAKNLAEIVKDQKQKGHGFEIKIGTFRKKISTSHKIKPFLKKSREK